MAPLAVSAFVGFAVGLLVAALFFPARVEVVEVPAPVKPETIKPEPVEPSVPAVSYHPVDVDSLPNWQGDTVSAALAGLKRACAMRLQQPETEPVGPGGLGGTVADWKAGCSELARLDENDDAALRALLASAFKVYAVESRDGPGGTFTGYYETSLNGSLTPSETFSVPLYAAPGDLVELDRRAFGLPADVPSVVGRVSQRRLVPYDTRAQIERDAAFKSRADVLVWVDDPVDAHLLHIQGSGRVTFPDGTSRRIGYAGNNGRGFRGIGGILLTAGVLGPGQGSMPSVADWLRRNPEAARTYMEENPRFIFFRWIDGPGPIGAYGVPLDPGRSLAVDPRYIPYGAPLWLDVNDPDGISLDRLVVALDTGSAIRGAVRGDYFWGAGEDAFMKAGRMKSTGRYYLFLPDSVTVPAAPDGSAL